MLYTIILTVHSWVRWFALVACVGTTLAAVTGRVRGENSPADRWALFAMMALDIQMLLGLLLYLGVSPNMPPILANFDGAMKDATLRFWAVEHTASMFAAILVAHLGRVLARKAATPVAKRARLMVCFGLAVVLMMLGMPWPGRPGGRELFRMPGDQTVGVSALTPNRREPDSPIRLRSADNRAAGPAHVIIPARPNPSARSAAPRRPDAGDRRPARRDGRRRG